MAMRPATKQTLDKSRTGIEPLIRNNQNGRRRGRGGARPPQAGGGPSGNYGNSGGNRMDVRQRGNATQLLEKYKALARDATQGGDRVQAEYFMQYADHYYRVLNEFRARDPQPAPRSYDDEDGDAPYNGQGNGQTYAAPQNYAPPQADGRYADEVDDEDGDDDSQRRQAPPQQDRANDRQDRVRAGGQDRQRSPSYARDDQRDNGQRDNGQRDNGQRDNGQRDQSARDGGQRDYGGREMSREAGQRDNGLARPARLDRPARDERNGGDARASGDARANGDVRVNGDGRPGERRPLRLDPRRADAEGDASSMTIPGLPGPATVAAQAPAADTPAPIDQPLVADTPVAADAAGADAPAPRRRGRPRKVVAVADESAGDA